MIIYIIFFKTKIIIIIYYIPIFIKMLHFQEHNNFQSIKTNSNKLKNLLNNHMMS